MLRGTATQPAARARVGSVGQRNFCVQEERLDDKLSLELLNTQKVLFAISMSMEAPAVGSDWTGTHVWTIDYAEIHQRAKAKRGHWFHSDAFMIGGHEFTMMVCGDGFEKLDTTPFGVFMCPKNVSGCLLTSFKVHLRFSGTDPLPSGQTAVKDFWEDENGGGNLGYNWGFQTYSPTVTHSDLVAKTSPLYQKNAKDQPIIIVEVNFCRVMLFFVFLTCCSCSSKYARILRSLPKKALAECTLRICARKPAMSALKIKEPLAT